MGIELVKAVTVRCGHLTGNEHKVLVRMASTALDRPNENGHPAGLYYAGWEPLARALGHKDPDPTLTKDERKAADRVRYELVRRALKGLRDAGQIEALQEHPQIGVRQCFRITPKSPDESAGHEPLQKVGALPPQGVGALPLQNVAESPDESAGPRTHTGLTEDLSQDSNHSSSRATTDRARTEGAA